MSEQFVCFLNGDWLARSELSISPFDYGFTMGVTVAERLRTFRHQAVFLDRHMNRFAEGLNTVGIDLSVDTRGVIIEVLSRNEGQVSANQDWDLSIFATPGSREVSSPTLAVVPSLLNFKQLESRYSMGDHLVWVDVVETAQQNWPRNLKCRSRMHYYLADQQARNQFEDARALLLNASGHVAETSTSLVAALLGNELTAPPAEDVLPSVSFAVASELLEETRCNVVRRNLAPEELAQASEILSFSSPSFVLPVTRLNGQVVGSGKPGKLFHDLIRGFENRYGLNLVGQAANR